jgi:hypothetical protein
MTSFVHPHFATHHTGADRLESTLAAIGSGAKNLNSSRGLTAMLLAAMVSAVLVVANQVIDSVSEGHLFAAWIALWTIAFATLAMCAAPARRMSASLRQTWTTWKQQQKAAASDAKLWSVALQDARVMADISAAISRHQSAAQDTIDANQIAMPQHLATRASYVSIAAQSAKIEMYEKASKLRIQRMLAAANGY